MDNIVTEFQDTDECEISIEKMVKVWNNNWCISQWHEEYTLCYHKRNSESTTDLKVWISKAKAHELIGKLNLVDERSPDFMNGRTWRQVV